MWVIVVTIAWSTFEVTMPSRVWEDRYNHTREIVLRFDSEAACRAKGLEFAINPASRRFALRKERPYPNPDRPDVGDTRRGPERVVRISDCAPTTPPIS